MTRLKDRIAVVTGSSSGIGQGIAVRFAQEGARVVINYAGHPEGANQTLDTIQKAGGQGVICQADVTSMDDNPQGSSTLRGRPGVAATSWWTTPAWRRRPTSGGHRGDYDKVLAVNLRPLLPDPVLRAKASGGEQARPCHQYFLCARGHGHASLLDLLRQQGRYPS